MCALLFAAIFAQLLRKSISKILTNVAEIACQSIQFDKVILNSLPQFLRFHVIVLKFSSQSSILSYEKAHIKNHSISPFPGCIVGAGIARPCPVFL